MNKKRPPRGVFYLQLQLTAEGLQGGSGLLSEGGAMEDLTSGVATAATGKEDLQPPSYGVKGVEPAVAVEAGVIA